jgi:hypothetical protein
LEKFHALVRVERNDFDFNLALRKPELPGGGEERKAAVIAASRAQHARPRAEVEAALLAEIRPGVHKPPEPSAPPSAGKAKTVPPAKPPKVAEVPKAAGPPIMAEISPNTDSEKENRDLSLVIQKSTVTNEEGVDLESKTEHEAVKDEIQAHAESLDYTVTRETPIPEYGRPDLILTRGQQSIACEISVTTHKTIEADHIRLRLKAGFTHVAVISQLRRKLPKIEAAFLQLMPGASLEKVGFYSRDDFLNQLSTWALDDPEGGALERAKPRKQDFEASVFSPENPAQQAEARRALLADLQRKMARDRQKQ